MKNVTSEQHIKATYRRTDKLSVSKNAPSIASKQLFKTSLNVKAKSGMKPRAADSEIG